MYTKMISICFQADLETDEVYAQMTLQPVTSVSTLAHCCFFSELPFRSGVC